MAECRFPFNSGEAVRLQAKPPKPTWLQRPRQCYSATKNTVRGYDYWTTLYHATPWWAAHYRCRFREIYAKCPPGYEVDHAVPLKHPLVCGLHVPWNLQYLPKRENALKGNRDWEDNPHATVDMFDRQPQQLRFAL